MGLWKRERKPDNLPTPVVQIRDGARHPFQMIGGYVPLHRPEFSLYRAIREAVPVVDAAILKLVRLAGGLSVHCGDPAAERELERFLRTVPTGWNQKGIQSFLDMYLDCLLTCGRAAGEIALSRDQKEIVAVLCGNISDIEVKPGDSPLDTVLAVKKSNGEREILPRQELLLFTTYHPTPEEPYGVSLLHSMPFLSGVLLKIYETLGANWERAGNVRFAVTYKPEADLDPRRVQERSKQIAEQWSSAMQSTRNGAIRDFVAVGDVEIKAIGGDTPLPDCQAPVRLLVEQLISQTGIPPFLLGLNWSSTERMSSQQADIMTSEITALRRCVEPAVERIAVLWLRMHGYDSKVEVCWEDINLQDQVEEAKAALYRRQAERLETDATQIPEKIEEEEE